MLRGCCMKTVISMISAVKHTRFFLIKSCCVNWKIRRISERCRLTGIRLLRRWGRCWNRISENAAALDNKSGMIKINILLCILIVNLYAASFIPRIEGTLCISPLFPSDQQLYYAIRFGDNFEPIDTTGKVRNFAPWMPGYSIGCKFGEFSRLKIGLNLKFDHFFQHKDSLYLDESEGELRVLPIDLHLMFFQGGFVSSHKISRNITLKPEVNFLLVRSAFYYHIENSTATFISPVYNVGLYTGIKFLYSKFEPFTFGSDVNFLFYSDIKDFTVNPFLLIRLHEMVSCYTAVNYSFLTNAVKPAAGFTISIF